MSVSVTRQWTWRTAVLATVLAAATTLAGTGPATAAACQPWNGAEPASPGQSSGLDAVTVVSACDVWMVGEAPDPSGDDTGTLVEHWTGGASWAVVPSPSPGTNFNELDAIDAISATNIWASGFYLDDSGQQGLLLHWDGSSWAQVSLPVSSSDVRALVAVSANDIWAATGDFVTGAPLMLHYDGTSWTSSPVPGLSATRAYRVTAMTATSAGDVWAVGSSSGNLQDGQGFMTQPLALHWDGSAWTQIPMPVTDTGDDPGTQLYGVSAVSPTDAWAVGDFDDDETPVILHWDGTSWTVVSAPIPGDGIADLVGVVAVSRDNVVVTGSYALGDPASPTSSQNLVLQWDGTAWGQVGASGTNSGNGLGGVAAAPNGSVWAAGGAASDIYHQAATAAEFGVMPSVIGDTQAAATAATDNASVATTINRITTPTGTCNVGTFGTVTSASAIPGSLAFAPVTLSVCDVMATVPNVQGFGDMNAQHAITSAGLAVGSVGMTPNCALSKGEVLTQSPSAGTTATPGSPVNLTESTGRQPNGKPCVTE